MSLASLITGDACAEAPKQSPLRLPDAVLARHIGVRKKPVARDRSQMISVMESVQNGMHPELTSVHGIAEQLGVNVRDLYEMAPDTARKTSAALALRAAHRRADRAAQRAREQSQAARQVADELARLGGGASKRVVEAAMATLGYVVPWEESKAVVDMVRRHMAYARPVTDGAPGK
mgnify:CR=1 FL=1